jgi:hypothetical protein
VTRPSMLGPALDEAVLEQLEAEFLQNPNDSWRQPRDPGAATVELPPPTIAWPVEDDPQGRMTRIRTYNACCR